MSDPPPYQSRASDYGDNPTAEEIKRISAAFDAYTAQRETAEAKNSKHNRKVRRWTRAAIVGAWIYTFVTALIFVYTIKSLHEARRAIATADRAADAATHQAKIAADTEERQLRAYLYVDPTGMTFFDTKVPPKFILHIHDAGQTFAKNVKIFTKIDVLQYPLPPHFLFKEPSETEFTGTYVISPKVPMIDWPVLDVPLTAEQLTAIRDGHAYRLYLYGVVRYIDVFDKSRGTKFCLSVGGEGLAAALDAYAASKPASPGSFEFCAQHNDAD